MNNKATIKFGFRPYFEVTYLSYKHEDGLVGEVIDLIKEAINLDAICTIEPFTSSSFGRQISNFRLDIRNLNRYLTIEEQSSLERLFKAKGFSCASLG